MHKTVAQFPSDALYESALVSHPSVAEHRLTDLNTIADPASEQAREDLHPTLVFFDTAGSEMYERLEGEDGDAALQKGSLGEGSRYNENEAEIVAQWARKLVSRTMQPTRVLCQLMILASGIARRCPRRHRHHHTLPSASRSYCFPDPGRISRNGLRVCRWDAGSGARSKRERSLTQLQRLIKACSGDHPESSQKQFQARSRFLG